MRRRPRTHYTDTQKALMWERWKKGETLHQIARLFDRPHTSIRQILAETGGIRPDERRRSSLALTLAEREEIYRALVAGESIHAVAVRLARAPSTIPEALLATEQLRLTRLRGNAWVASITPPHPEDRCARQDR